jgi:hypothetical protein
MAALLNSMFIKMKDGPKKGEIQEMKYFVARDLIIAGRAEQYFFDADVSQAPPTYSAKSEAVQPCASPVKPQEPIKKKKK